MTRKWNSGPPPHDGWWLTRHAKADKRSWRWRSDGVWSLPCYETDSLPIIGHYAVCSEWPHLRDDVQWCDYWPENARVPRIDPRKT